MRRKTSLFVVAFLFLSVVQMADAGVFSRKVATRCTTGTCNTANTTQAVNYQAVNYQAVNYQAVNYQAVNYQQTANTVVQTPVYQNYNHQNVASSHGRDVSTAQGVANFMARTLQFGHFGNPTGGYEGCGMAGTAEAAIRNCCYYGQRPIKDYGVAQAANGLWYACCRYN